MNIDRGIVAALGGSLLPLLLAGVLYSGSGIRLALVLAGRALTSARADITWARGRERARHGHGHGHVK